MLNLDTHILIHALKGQLTVKEREVLANDQWGISAIVIWELSKLAQLGRIDLDIDSADFARALSSIEKAASRTLSLVGLVPRPAGATRRRPPFSPPIK